MSIKQDYAFEHFLEVLGFLPAFTSNSSIIQ